LTPDVIEETESIRTALRKLMWEKAGIIRCAVSLTEAKEKLCCWKKITEGDFLTRAELELKNMVTIAGLIVEAAHAREGSVGAHYRSDHRGKGKDWQSHRRWDKSTFNFASADTIPSGKTACR
jgi:L-aspartate oxidase